MQLARLAQNDGDAQRHDLGDERRDPDGLCAKNHGQRKDHQRLDRDAAADGDGVGRSGALGGEKVGRIDEIQRHRDKRQGKERQRRRGGLDERRLAVENADDWHGEEVKPAVDQRGQHGIDD